MKRGLFQISYFDQERASRKAQRIRSILEEFTDLAGARCLDLGCGSGLISQHLSECCREIIGADISPEAIELASQIKRPNLSFILLTREAELPFPDEHFDVIIHHAVLNYVRPYRQHLEEIHRVLRRGGICYLSCANRYRLFAGRLHGIPNYVCWLPPLFLRLYLRMTPRQGEVPQFLFLPSFWQLKRLLRRFLIHDYTAKVLTDPGRYWGGDPGGMVSHLRLLPPPLVHLFKVFAGNFILVLRKG